MTATATAEKTVSVEEKAHRDACAHLKGYIVGYSKRHGMKWDGDPDRTPEFARGFECSRNVGPKTLTFAHVVHNRLRHGRPHLGSASRDEEFVQWFRKEFSVIANPLLAALAEYGLDVKEVL